MTTSQPAHHRANPPTWPPGELVVAMDTDPRSLVSSSTDLRIGLRARLLLYAAYLASKLATQVAVALAASVTACGRPCSLADLVRGKAATGRIHGALATSAVVAGIELASTVLLTACLASWWMYSGTHSGAGGIESFITAFLLLLLLLALVSHVCVAAVFSVAIAVSVEEEGGGGVAHLRRAWRLITVRGRRKEAAVMVLVASLLPVASYMVYGFAVYCGTVMALVFVPGYLLPSAGVLLHSTVAATVFYHRCMEHHQGLATSPSTTKLAS